MSKLRRIACLSLMGMIAHITQAHAQSIDYSSLQSLFGEPVTTSATGKPQRVSEAPVAMEILSAEQIRRTGAHNIAEVMRTVSGMSVWQWSREGYDLNIRGNNQEAASRLLVLVNGRQIYLDHYSITNWLGIPIQLGEVRQIEIVKGPNTALFGFNAADGVVNFVTYHPLHDKVSSASVTAGTGNHRQANVITTLPFGERASIRISANKMHENEFNSETNGRESPKTFIDPSQQSIGIDAALKVTDTSMLRLEGTNSNAHLNDGSPLFFLLPFEYETNAQKASYESDTKIGLIKASIYQNQMDMHLTSSIRMDMKNQIIVSQIEDLIQAGNHHTFRIMGEYRDNDLTGFAVGDGAKSGYKNYATSSMWNWIINDQLDWTNAVRVDYLMLGRTGGSWIAASPYTNEDYEQQHFTPSYNSGLVWKATDKDKFRLALGRGIEAPGLYELSANFVSSTGPIRLGNPRLNPTTVDSYELGWDRKISTISGGLRSSLFYKNMHDIKVPPSVYAARNVGSSDATGAELKLKGAFAESYTWDAGYIIENANVNLLAGTRYPRRFDATTPTHMINAHLGYKTGAWELDGYSNYISDAQNYEFGEVLTDIKSYITVGARAAYYLNEQTSIALSGQNLQSQHTQQTSGPDVERTVYLTLTRDF